MVKFVKTMTAVILSYHGGDPIGTKAIGLAGAGSESRADEPEPPHEQERESRTNSPHSQRAARLPLRCARKKQK